MSVSNLQSEETNLKRELGLFSSANVLIGIMVGSGIFYLGSYVLMRCGMSLGLALLVWIIGGVITLLSGLCFAELGAMMPKAGGTYVYLREAYGERVAFVSGISSFILGSCGSTAAIALAFSGILGGTFGAAEIVIKLIAVVSVVLLTLINIIGVKRGSLVQNIFTVGKLVPMILILFGGLFVGGSDNSFFTAPVADGGVTLGTVLSMIAFATVATFWAYEGWTNLNVISEEIKNPKKNIPLAIIIAVSSVTILYTLFNFAVYNVVPFETISTLFEEGNYYLGTTAAEMIFGSAGGVIVTICMIVAIFGALNGCVLVFPRTCLAIARDGLLPAKCAEVNERFKTPVVALLVHGVISIILIFMRNLSQMTALVTFTAMVFNILTFYCVIRFRKIHADMERPYKTPTWIVYFTLVVMVGLLINTLVSDFVTSVIGLSVPALVLIAYEIMQRVKKNKTQTNNNDSTQ